MDLRSTARFLFAEALDRTQLHTALRRGLPVRGGALLLPSGPVPLHRMRRILVIALGKAALPMADALLSVDPVLTSAQTLQGIVLGTALPTQPDPRLLYRLGAHPFPDASSVDAAREVLALLSAADANTLVFFLISGGASAMMDLPLDPTVPFGDLAAFHRALVHSGLPIGAMNTLRKHVSAVKGGRLAVAAAPAWQCTLLVSDVPPSQAEIIASGPTLPDPTTLHDCRHLLQAHAGQLALPASVLRLLHDPATPETPKPGHPAFANGTHATLLSSEDLLRAAQDAAHRLGFRTAIDNSVDECHFAHAAEHLLRDLHTLSDEYPDEPVCLLSAGELAVPLPAGVQPGMGGRNQHFALHCALQLRNRTQPTVVFSAGSDGADGNSPAAGAVVDQTSAERAEHLGLNPVEALATFDSYPLLHALGDTVVTGPTGNNLRDLRLLLVAPRRQR